MLKIGPTQGFLRDPDERTRKLSSGPEADLSRNREAWGKKQSLVEVRDEMAREDNRGEYNQSIFYKIYETVKE